ncbi:MULTISPECIES: hypothetical protein [unclassified Methanosarcina]|uniref:hypothetical protein n=1 Tax=unclassified Methanosarcina TaxID=2644672 RepID=UPI000615F680|nr:MULTISPECIES: hypothetical protein [unclassified Methanosarcina]AKB17062.1 hypothetical protein MSWHS_0199 [Methanosarcina sp. WWM596]AKB20459.1 hypothetical protein MSWH1_0188 [Methanosarcina sp. WH1]
MLIRKNISLDDKYLKKLQPLLEANDGNLSAAVRDTIEVADIALSYHRSIDEAIKFLKETPAKEELSDTIKNGENTIINRTMLEWLFKYTKGRLTDEELVNELINPFEISDMKELENYLNRISRNYQWTIRTSIKCEDIHNPESALILLSNATINSREFFAQLIAHFLARWKQLDVEHIFRRANSTQISFKKNLSVSLNETMPGIRKHFGYLDIICRELDDNTEFWTQLMYTYNVERYNLVTLHRSQFETFTVGDVPNPTKILERLCKQSVSEMSLPDLLIYFKKMYLATQLVKNIEIYLEPGKESVTIFHDFKNEKVINTLVEYFSNIFREQGTPFVTTSYSSMIVFRFYKEYEPLNSSDLAGVEGFKEPDLFSKDWNS